MQAPVTTLVAEFVRRVQLPRTAGEDEAYLRTLVAELASSPAMLKRDMRRLLEKDPRSFLKAACQVLTECPDGPGAAYLADLLWSSARLFDALADPQWMPLAPAITLAKLWIQWEPLLDIKLLQIGFSSDSGATAFDMARAHRVLAILRELPPERHLLLPLSNLLRSRHEYVRLTAVTLYGRAANSPEWVRRRLSDVDATVRAHAVISLWGAGSETASAVLQEAARDSDPRVAANALVGLHYGGAADVSASLHAMAAQGDPKARAAAAFAMGQTLHSGCKAALRGLLKDRDPQVRGEALQALIRVHRCSPATTALPA